MAYWMYKSLCCCHKMALFLDPEKKRVVAKYHSIGWLNFVAKPVFSQSMFIMIHRIVGRAEGT